MKDEVDFYLCARPATPHRETSINGEKGETEKIHFTKRQTIASQFMKFILCILPSNYYMLTQDQCLVR